MGLISRVSSRTYRSLPKYSELKQRPNMSETIECKFNISDYFYTNPDYKVFNLTNFDKHPECKILVTNRVFIEKQKEKEGVVLNYPEDTPLSFFLSLSFSRACIIIRPCCRNLNCQFLSFVLSP